MGKGSKKSGSSGAAAAQRPQAAAPAVEATTDEKEQRFMQALKRMMGCTGEPTEEEIRKAITGLTQEQRQELLAEGQDLKKDLLNKPDLADNRKVFFSEVNTGADQAGMPISKDGEFLAKKVNDFMTTSKEDIPQLLLVEALASTPYLVKLALTDAKSEAAVPAADLAEIETALALLRVPGWREGEATGRPPFVRRNLLLLHAHLHREHLKAVTVSEETKVAQAHTAYKAGTLLDMFFVYTMQASWVKGALACLEARALFMQGLWSHTDDECHTLMKNKAAVLGLKMPKLVLRAVSTDTAPGEKVKLKVTVSRLHAHTAAELEAYNALQPAEEKAAADAAAAEGEEKVEDNSTGKEGWWLFVESIRGSKHMESTTVAHNQLAARQMLTPGLEDGSLSTQVEFDAPQTPGEYRVIVHIKSSSFVGVDVSRKVPFQVKEPFTKGRGGAAPSSNTSSGTSSESAGSSEDLQSVEVEKKAALVEGSQAAEAKAAKAAKALLNEESAEKKKAAKQEAAAAKGAAAAQQQQKSAGSGAKAAAAEAEAPKPAPTGKPLPKTRSWADLVEEGEEDSTSPREEVKAAPAAPAPKPAPVAAPPAAAAAPAADDDGWSVVGSNKKESSPKKGNSPKGGNRGGKGGNGGRGKPVNVQ